MPAQNTTPDFFPDRTKTLKTTDWWDFLLWPSFSLFHLSLFLPSLSSPFLLLSSVELPFLRKDSVNRKHALKIIFTEFVHLYSLIPPCCCPRYRMNRKHPAASVLVLGILIATAFMHFLAQRWFHPCSQLWRMSSISMSPRFWHTYCSWPLWSKNQVF